MEEEDESVEVKAKLAEGEEDGGDLLQEYCCRLARLADEYGLVLLAFPFAPPPPPPPPPPRSVNARHSSWRMLPGAYISAPRSLN